MRGYKPKTRLAAAALVVSLILSLGLPIGVYGADPECGLEEHTHTAACYLIPGAMTYSCTKDSMGIHTHTEDCVDEAGAYTCGYSDFVIHEHDALCYDADGDLVCTLEEHSLHTHTEDCYEAQSVLVCGEEEDLGHSHADACYTESQTLSCTLEESDGHHHDETCYAGCEEDHEHTDACLSCGQEESDGHQHSSDCYVSEKTLTCTEEEWPAGHVHTDTCYETQSVLACGQDELSFHSHAASCFSDGIYESGELICGQVELFEHQHTDACVTISEPVVSDTPVCGKEEHQHDDSCYENPVKEHALTVHFVALDGEQLTEDTTVSMVLEEGEKVSFSGYVNETMTVDKVSYAFSYATSANPAGEEGDEVYQLSSEDGVLTYSGDGKSFAPYDGAEVWAVYEEIPNVNPLVGMDCSIYAAISIDKTLNGFFPAGEYDFSFVCEEDDGSSQTISLTTTVAEDGTYSSVQATEPLLYTNCWISRNKTETTEATFIVKENSAADSLLIDDRWYEIDVTTNVVKGILLPNVSADIVIYHCTADGTKNKVQEYTQDIEIDENDDIVSFPITLSFENSYFNNVSAYIDKTLTSNFPAGDYSFDFQVDATLNGTEYTRVYTVEATVDEDGNYTITSGPITEDNELIGLFVNSANIVDQSLTFTVKELPSNDKNVVIPDYYYEGTVSIVVETSAWSLRSNDDIMPLVNVPDGLVWMTVDKVSSDGTSVKVFDERVIKETWTDESSIKTALTFENDYEYSEPTSPTITKEVFDDASQSWVETTLLENADDRPFRVTLDFSKSYLDSRDTLAFTLHDETSGVIGVYLSDLKSASVQLNGVDVTNSYWTASYADNGGKDISFADINQTASDLGIDIEDGAVIVIEYLAYISDSYLYYGDGPTDENKVELYVDDEKIAEDSAYVVSPELYICKTDGAGNTLKSARFILYRWDGSSYQYFDSITLTGSAKLDGMMVFPGQYKLVESIAPSGYMLSTTSYEFEVTAALDNGKLTMSATSINGEDAPFWDATNERLQINIVNTPSEASMKKEVYNPETGRWGTSLAYDQGETLQYRLVSNVPGNIADYETCPFTFYDSVSSDYVNFFDLLSDTISVSIDGELVDSSQYEVEVDSTNSAFVLTFPDLVATLSILETPARPYAEIVVAYSMTFDGLSNVDFYEEEMRSSEGFTNYAYVKYASYKTNTAEATICSHFLRLNKVDEYGNPLLGAVFTLYKERDGQWVKLSESSEDENASHVFIIGDGNYKIVETTVPDGYVKSPDFEFSADAGPSSYSSSMYYHLSVQNSDELAPYLTVVSSYSPAYEYTISNLRPSPTLTKKVWVDDESHPDGGAWCSQTVAAAGDTLHFQLTGTLPSDIETYSTYYYSFYDDLSDAYLNFVTDTVEVSVNGQVLDSAYYSAAVSWGELSVTFNDIISTFTSLNIPLSNTEICVTFDATVRDKRGTLTNVAYIKHTSGASTTTQGSEASASICVPYLNVNKMKYDKTYLTGSDFELYRWNGTEYELYQVGEVSSGKYFYFNSLKTGQYRLVETTAPEGYAKAPDIDFEVLIEKDASNDGAFTISAWLLDEAAVSKYVFSFSASSTSLYFNVINHLSAENKPQITKQVLEEDHVLGETPTWGSSASVDTQHEVYYRMIGTLPDDLSGYETYAYTFHDSRNSLLLINEDSFSVTIDGKPVSSEDYALSFVSDTVFELSFADIKSVLEKYNVSEADLPEIIVNYSCMVEEDESLKNGASNKAYIIYEDGESRESTTIVESTFFYVLKYGENDNARLDATFMVYRWDGEAWEEYCSLYVPGDRLVYSYGGFDKGHYKIVETDTPAGYSPMEDVEFIMADVGNYTADDITILTPNAPISFSDSSKLGEMYMYIYNEPFPHEVTKEVLKSSDVTGTNDAWQSWATGAAGEKMSFRLTGTLPNGASVRGYQSYVYEFHDTIDGQLTLDRSSIQVYIDDTLIKPIDYSVQFNCSDGCSFEVLFSDLVSVASTYGMTYSLDGNSTIVVTYDATLANPLNRPNTSSYEGEKNSVYLKYSYDTEIRTSEESEAQVYSFDILVNKVDLKGEPVKGASFALQKWNGSEYVDYQTGVNVTDTQFSFAGLDAGSYQLVETVVPDGYESEKTFQFVIRRNDADDGFVLEGSSLRGIEETVYGWEFNIQNTLPFTLKLPDTGSSMTLILYLTGIISAGFGIFLLKKKKYSGIAH